MRVTAALAGVIAGIVLAFSSAAGATSTGSLSFLTDSSWTVNGSPASVIYPSCYAGYGAWTTALGYNWIGPSACSAPGAETDTYSKTFNVPGTPTSASIQIAADNEVSLYVNGTNLLSQTDAYSNFHTLATVDIAPYLSSGSNTIDAVVTNTGPGLSVTGVVAQVSVTYNLPDSTPPSISPTADITAEATGANGAQIDYTTPTATDNVDGTDAVSCDPASGSIFPLGTTTVNCSAADAAGNPASSSFNVTVQDTTGPSIAAASDITAEATGPDGAAVDYTTPSATDAVDGTDAVSCLPASGSTFPLGSTTVNCSSSDAAGNAGSSSFNVLVQDTTKPSIAYAGQSPAANGAGWNNGSVTLAWNCTDAVSGTWSVSQTLSGEGANQSATGTCTDGAGNSSSDTQGGVNIDLTSPTVTYTGGGTYTVDQNVSITCSSSDALSGVASDTCAGVSAPAWSLGLGTHPLSATATDMAGNQGSGSTSYKITVDGTSLCNLVTRWAKNAGEANSLCAKLNAAAAAAARGQLKAKQNNIDAFDNEVRAQSGKSFTAAQAALLIQFAAAL